MLRIDRHSPTFHENATKKIGSWILKAVSSSVRSLDPINHSWYLTVAIALPLGAATTVLRPSRTPQRPSECSRCDIERGSPTPLPSINSR
jgi:hypothetical protein